MVAQEVEVQTQDRVLVESVVNLRAIRSFGIVYISNPRAVVWSEPLPPPST